MWLKGQYLPTFDRPEKVKTLEEKDTTEIVLSSRSQKFPDNVRNTL